MEEQAAQRGTKRPSGIADEEEEPPARTSSRPPYKFPFRFPLDHVGGMTLHGTVPGEHREVFARGAARLDGRWTAGVPGKSPPPPFPPATTRPTRFSIDDILGRHTGAEREQKPTTTTTTMTTTTTTTTATIASSLSGHSVVRTACEDVMKTTDDDAADDDFMEEASSYYSWLQCTRYKPPKLPRNKKKEMVKKRKLGRNPRVPFTQHQVKVLEDKFRQTHYLSSVDVAELSAALSLTETRVKIWFQNRRARERRDRECMQHQHQPPTSPASSSTLKTVAKTVAGPPERTTPVRATTAAFSASAHAHAHEMYRGRHLATNWPKPMTPDEGVLAQFSSAYFNCASAFTPVPFYSYC